MVNLHSLLYIIISHKISCEAAGCVLKDVYKDALNFYFFWYWKAVITNQLYLSCKEISGLVTGNMILIILVFPLGVNF